MLGRGCGEADVEHPTVGEDELACLGVVRWQARAEGDSWLAVDGCIEFLVSGLVDYPT